MDVRGTAYETRSVASGTGTAGHADPVWARGWFTTTLSAITLVALVAFHLWWWRGHGEPISWVLLIATPLIAVLPAGLIVAARRRRWVQAWARDNGFSYAREPGWPIPEWDFPPFSVTRARRQRIRDGMTGRIGDHPATYFHFTWINNNRVQASTHYRNVFVLTMPDALPRLTLGINLDPSTGSRVLFESAVFNDRFQVYCHDPAFAHAVITPRTMDALLTLSTTSGAAMMSRFEIAGDRAVATSTAGNRPEQISEVFEALRIIVDGVPPFVWRAHPTLRPAGGMTP